MSTTRGTKAPQARGAGGEAEAGSRPDEAARGNTGPDSGGTVGVDAPAETTRAARAATSGAGASSGVDAATDDPEARDHHRAPVGPVGSPADRPDTRDRHPDPLDPADPASGPDPVLVPSPHARRPRLLGRRAPATTPRRKLSLASLLRRVLSLAVALGLWQYLTVNDITWWVRFDRLPTVTEVASEFGDQLGGATYYDDLEASLTRILSGFVLAAFAGIAVGILVTRSRVAGDLLQPLLEVVRPIPAIAMVPIAILVFPTDEQGITFITFLAAFFPILVSTRHAVRALPTLWEDALRTMGGRRRHTLWHVVLPGTLPGVFGGLSVGMGVSWICVISAEMISGQYGVGYRTWQAYTIVDYPGVIVGMISIGLLGWATAGLVELAGRRATRWLPREGGTR